MTIASILDQARHEPGRRDIVLNPLDLEASARLVQNFAGLDVPSAQMVAEVAAGFPALAFALAEAKADNPDADLVRLAHLQSTSSLLENAIPDPLLRQALAPLALFQGLGFEDDLAYEFDAVAEIFGHDPQTLRTVIDIEQRRSRFVSAAGRYRSVSPTLVAVWLAADLIDRTNDLDTIIDALPEPVQRAFVAQLEFMGPVSDQLSASLARLLESSDRFRRPPDFDEAAARLLRAAAAVVPEQAATALKSLLANANPSQLRSMPRRELVTALQRLVWFPSTIDFALDALWLLAQHENESWSNNATGTFQEAFNLYLGGTTVDFERRSAWLGQRIEATTDQDELHLLAAAAAKGLKVDYFRMRDSSLELLRLDEWHPKSRDEESRGRQLAALNLLRCLDRAVPERTREIADMLGQAIWSLRPAGLLDWLADELAGRDLDNSARAALLIAVARGERVEEEKKRDPSQFARLRAVLEGTDFYERLAIALRSGIWDLAGSREEMLDVPTVLRELADEVPDEDDAIDRVLGVNAMDVDENTRFVFVRLLARRLGAARVGEFAKASPRLDQHALAACLSVADELGEAEWADSTLDEVGTRDPDLLALMSTYVALDDRRLTGVLDVIDATGAPVRALGRLVGGARVRDLGPETAARLLATMITDSDATGDALLMADQLIEQSPISDELHAHVFTLVMKSLTSGPGTMDEYIVGRLVDRHFLRAEELAELWTQRMRSREGLVDEVDVRLTDALANAAPESFLDAVIDHVKAEAAGDVSVSLFASRDLHLLARAANVVSLDEIVARLHSLNERELRISTHHLLWSGDVPHPLTARFLESELLEGLEREAFTCFFNTLGVVTGAYWRALQRERNRARLWAEALAASPKAAAWARELVRGYDADISQQRRFEAEEDLRLGR